MNDIYSEYIVDLYRQSRKEKHLQDFTCEKELHNTLCGDKINIRLLLNNNCIQAISSVPSDRDWETMYSE